MAVSINNPWAAGAVVLDQRPFEAFYERQMARQQAKNDALDNYFKDLNKNITTTGMRSQDVPMLLQKNKDWQEHAIQNKAAIANPKLDNGEAYRKYMAGYQEQMALTNESKAAQKNKEELGKMKFNKDFSYVFEDPNVINDIEADDLPIGDPRRRPLDITSLALPPKPIGTKEKEELSKYIIGEVKPDKIRGVPINVGGFQTQTPITHQYSDTNKQVFGQRAADVYDTDKSWRVYANQLFKDAMHDPVKYHQLNNIYKKHYGNDIDSPKEAFVAQTIADHDIKSIEYEKGEDKWGLEQAKERLSHGYRLSEMEARQALKDKSAGEQNTIIDNLYEGLKDDAKKDVRKYEPGTGKPYNQYEMKASGAVKNMFAVKNSSGHTVYPDAVRFSEDFSTVTPIFYEHYRDEKTGKELPEVVKTKDNRAKVISDLSQPMREPEFKERWKKEIMGAQAYGKQLSKGVPNSNKPKTVMQGGHIYHLNEATGEYE